MIGLLLNIKNGKKLCLSIFAPGPNHLMRLLARLIMKPDIIVPKTAKNSNNSSRLRKKYPPYAKLLESAHQNSDVIVCTGSDGWNRARSLSWAASSVKLVLPFGDDPSAYRWPVLGRECSIFELGKPEPDGVIYSLAQGLLASRASLVLWVRQNEPIIKFNPVREVRS